MAKRNILVLEKKEGLWANFLQEFFEDTPTTLTVFHESADASQCLDRTPQDLVFIEPELLSLSLAQKLKVLRQSRSGFRVFRIGISEKTADDLMGDARFEEIPPLALFQKQLVQHLPLPEKVKVLVVDDDIEIAHMVRDYLDHRVQPAFEVEHMENGAKGIEALEKKLPDVLVLDIKMPVLDGREVYREVVQRGWKVPVIIFFDAIFGDEMMEIHRYGRPAVVEKGARLSAMPEMMALIKKMVYFG